MQKTKPNQRGASRMKNANNNQKAARDTARNQKRADLNSFSRAEAAPVARAEKFKNKNPEIAYKVDGSSCRVRHTERIGTVNGSVAFTTTAYAVNPGLPSSFPYLAGIANRFESYRFNSLVFHYKTKTATTALGDVIQVVDYDASDAAPETSIQAEAYQGATSSAPWQDNRCVSTKQNLMKLPSRYVRGEAIPANTDIKLYDVGNYYVCTENQASAALIGYLYVTYDIELMTPQLRASDFGISGGTVAGGTAMTAANPMGTAPVIDAQARGFSLSAASVVTLSSPGTYLLSLKITGTVLSDITIAAVSGCVMNAAYAVIANAAATIVQVSAYVVSSTPNATFSIAATGTTVTASRLDIASGPSSSFALMAEPTLIEGPCQKHQALYLGLAKMGRQKDFQLVVGPDSKCGCIIR